MLISLKMKYFRRHESTEISFASGLNAIRGANEAGKSTIIEAALYALYGSKALRDTLAETVTWGHKEKDLHVELVIRVRESMYRFTRSKAGAECHGDDGVVVTGQAEVSAYAAELLGADAKVASSLMLASQSGLRGALDDGPGAVSGLMAKLADFDIIDRILSAANERLQLGSTQPIAAKIDAAEREIAEAQAAMPSEAQRGYLESAQALYASEVDRLTQLEDKAYQPAVFLAAQAVDQAEEWNVKAEATAKRVAEVERVMAVEEERKKQAAADMLKAPGDAVIAQCREDAQRESNHAAELVKYRHFQTIKYPADFWDGTLESFEADIAEARAHLTETQNRVAALEGERRALISQRITNGRCPTCGHAARSDEHVAAHNAEIDAKVAKVDAAVSAAKVTLNLAKNGVQARDAVMAAHKAMQASLSKIADRVKLDLNFVPHRAAWDGPVPDAEASTAARTRLQEVEQQQRLAEQARGRYESSLARLRDLDKELEEARAAILQPVSPEQVALLKQAHQEAYERYRANSVALNEAKTSLGVAQQELSKFDASLQAARNTVESARRRVVEYQSDIRAIEFNNNLVTKLKKIKPAITDHLWNTVLAAVSTFFSQMRGESSVVTKDSGGFKVNDKSMESLSGSTIDVLALAVRVALTKTFIPHASFMVLDEPAHGCDNDRTGNVLGFLSSVGFKQTILASHDELSEAVADNVISLTA